MSVRAKFKCTKNGTPEGVTSIYQRDIVLETVYQSDDKNNESWSKYTPSGSLRMCVTNPLAYDQFEVGKYYYIDFTEAE